MAPAGPLLVCRIGAAPTAATLAFTHQQIRNYSWWNPLGYVYNPSASPSKPPSSASDTTTSPVASATTEAQVAQSTSELASTVPDATSQAVNTTGSTTAVADHAATDSSRQLSEEAAAEVARLSEHFSHPSTNFDLASFQQSLLDMPEEIGFLGQLGLDFGWGPSSMMQWVIEHVYIWSGLPWWGTLAVCAIGFRLAFVKVTMSVQESSVKTAQLMGHPKFKALDQEMRAALQRNDMPAMMKARQEMLAMRRLSGASFRPMLLNFLNIPISFGFFRVLRNMADIPVPSLETGGLLWFADLTVPDPYYILPILSTVGIVALMRSAGPALNPAMQKMNNVMLFIFTPLTALVSLKFAAGLQWFFCVTGLMTICLNYLRMQPWFRVMLGYSPTPPQPPTNVPNIGSLFNMGEKDANKFVNANYQAPNQPNSGNGTTSNPTVLPKVQDVQKTDVEAGSPVKTLLGKLGIDAAANELKTTFNDMKTRTQGSIDEKQKQKEEKDREAYNERRMHEEEEARRARIEAKRFRKH